VNREAAIGSPKPQNLKVDALFRADIEDARRDAVPATRTSTVTSQPAWILSKMQIDKQSFGPRLISYVSKIYGELPINVKQGKIPSPVYSTVSCMWDCGQLVRSRIINSNDLDATEIKRLSEISYSSTFLGNHIKILKIDLRNSLNTRLQKGQDELKAKVICFFKQFRGDCSQFDNLTFEEKKVYLQLEFLSLAHLMTEEQKGASLECLRVHSNADVNAAIDMSNNAYDVVRLNFKGVDMEEIKEKYPETYGSEEERLEKEKAEIQPEQGFQSTINMIEAVAGLP
jgi:hypothetical protein